MEPSYFFLKMLIFYPKKYMSMFPIVELSKLFRIMADYTVVWETSHLVKNIHMYF